MGFGDVNYGAVVLATVLAFLLVSPVVAQGPTPQVDDGNALQRECATALRAADTDATAENQAESESQSQVERGFHMGQCLGLVSGVWHTHMMMIDEFGGQPAFCPPRTISAGQMARLVDQYLQVHPAELDDWDTVLILRAFMDIYPCESRE